MSHYSFITKSLLLACAILYGSAAHAQAFGESEPNDACFAAQTIGSISFPSTVAGSLDSSPEFPDVDFFAFEAQPGEILQVDLEGSYTGAGTLQDPFLGLFDSNCALLAINDDSNGLNSRLVFVVPDDGLFVLGVTTCCDSAFTGGGVGSYLLTLDVFRTIDSVSGRLVNATSGEPVSGSHPSYASAYLLRCSGGNCFEYVAYRQVETDGTFLFDADFNGNGLAVGTYQVQANANGFEYYTGEPFEVAEGEMKYLGDLAMTPLQLIGSISGRLVDAYTGSPLPGNVPPYPYVQLNRCEDWGCYGVVGIAPDEMGNFSIDGSAYYLSPGTYQLFASAQQDYQQATSAQFTVAAFEDVNFGDFALTPFPIQFGAAQACEIPFGAEACEYSIEIVNRGNGNFRGEAWSIVDFYNPTNNATYQTRFQVGRNGIQDARPERIKLKLGQATTLSFQLDVPASVPVGSTLCASITVGKYPVSQFNSQGERNIFCSYKQADGFVAMPEKESLKWLQDRKSHRGLSRDRQGDPSKKAPPGRGIGKPQL